MIRKATIADVRTMYALLTRYATTGVLLPRSLSDLYDQLRDFFVFVPADADTDTPVAMCSLHICWEDIAEIRSLAVEESYLRQGIGRQLVSACLEEARTLQIGRVFVLTYVPPFFEKMGFDLVDKAVLPHKVWADCIKCVKFPDCDEIALMRDV